MVNRFVSLCPQTGSSVGLWRVVWRKECLSPKPYPHPTLLRPLRFFVFKYRGVTLTRARKDATHWDPRVQDRPGPSRPAIPAPLSGAVAEITAPGLWRRGLSTRQVAVPRWSGASPLSSSLAPCAPPPMRRREAGMEVHHVQVSSLDAQVL